MPSPGESEARDVAGKLRLTAAALGCAGQKELCAAFRAVNPKTGFDLDRSYKWIQGRSLPRSAQIYEDWAAVLGLRRPGAWVASSTLAEFAEVVSARRGADREALLRRAGLDAAARGGAGVARGGGTPGAGEDYLCGGYATYSLAQSPYYRGRIIRGTLAIEPAARRAEGLVATHSQALATGRRWVTGPAVVSGRALALGLMAHSPGAAPVFIHLVLPAPPASLLVGLMSSFVMVSPDGQPPYARRIVMLRTPLAAAALEESNRFLEEPDAAAALARDLPALALRVADPDALAAALGRFLTSEDGTGEPPGSMRISMEGYVALAAACDRAWLDTTAAGMVRPTEHATEAAGDGVPAAGRRAASAA